MTDEPILTAEKTIGYVITLLVGIGLGFAITILAIWIAIK